MFGSGYWIPVVSGILDSFSCIPDFASKIFADSRFRIPPAKTSRNSESVFPYVERLSFWKQFTPFCKLSFSGGALHP